MNQISKYLPLALVLFFVPFLWQCEEEKTESDINFSRESAIVNMTVVDILIHTQESINLLEDTLENSSSKLGLIGFSYENTLYIDHWDTLHWPKEIHIDYPNSTVSAFDRRIRQGKIKIQASGYWLDSAATFAITFDQYKLNNYLIQGDMEIQHLYNESGTYEHFTVSTNGLLISDDINTINAKFERTLTWESGTTTGYPLTYDDSYVMEGSGTLTHSSKMADSKIVQPLRIAYYCPWINSGGMDLTSEEGITETLNYGSGDCDSLATVIIGPQEVTFELE